MPSFRGPRVSAGFRAAGVRTTYTAYLDGFGKLRARASYEAIRSTESLQFSD